MVVLWGLIQSHDVRIT